MRPEQRQREIVAHLRAIQEELSVEQLANLFHVSGLTIRRDLEQLEKAATVLRTHGGCVLRSTVASVYHQRIAHNFRLKQAIGRAAAREVRPGDVILITDGSTPFQLAAHLGDKTPLSVYTNSLAVITELSRYRGIRLHVLGGQYDPGMHFLSGSLTEQVLENLNFDAVFLGTDAVDTQGRCWVDDHDVARLAQIMLRRGRRRILLADHTKVGHEGHVLYGKLSDFNVWYTTAGLTKSQLRQLGKLTCITESKLPREMQSFHHGTTV